MFKPEGNECLKKLTRYILRKLLFLFRRDDQGLIRPLSTNWVFHVFVQEELVIPAQFMRLEDYLIITYLEAALLSQHQLHVGLPEFLPQSIKLNIFVADTTMEATQVNLQILLFSSKGRGLTDQDFQLVLDSLQLLLSCDCPGLHLVNGLEASLYALDFICHRCSPRSSLRNKSRNGNIEYD